MYQNGQHRTNPPRPQGGHYKNADISVIRALSGDKRNLFIDLRKASVFRAVHIENTVNIPYEVFKSEILRFCPDRNRPVHLFCTSGEHSVEAAEYMVASGYTTVYNLGAISGWKYGFVSSSNGRWVRCQGS